jgi:hypothetical protein
MLSMPARNEPPFCMPIRPRGMAPDAVQIRRFGVLGRAPGGSLAEGGTVADAVDDPGDGGSTLGAELLGEDQAAGPGTVLALNPPARAAP